MHMKRTTKLFVVAIAVAAATISAPRAGSSDPTKFLLTIENGNTSGNYAAGTLVVVRANAPQAGAEFGGWTGDIAILSNPFLPETTATIPYRAVTITATYTPAFNPFLILDAILERVWGG
jgi:hypothetical protein